ncbi:MAG TPA: hypothetical protein GXX77_00980 [Candidatus Cloacimonetes bacterium]|nr:hypothetical protein [Candidatus Cloacimonadota bacterium]
MTKEKFIKDVATKINKMINIPFINEETEQVLFELIVGILIGLLFDKFLGEIL